MAVLLARDAQEHEEEERTRFTVPFFPYLRPWADPTQPSFLLARAEGSAV